VPGATAGTDSGAYRSAFAEQSADRRALLMTRRRLLAAGGLGAAGLYVSSAEKALAEIITGPIVNFLTIQPDFVVTLRRREDMLSLQLEGYNLRLDKVSNPDAPKIIKKTEGQKSYLAFVFAQQNVAEQAFLETAGELPPTPDLPGKPGSGNNGSEALPLPGNIMARLAGNSRLAFEVPPGTVIPFTMDGVLSWANLIQSVVPVAKTTDPTISRVGIGRFSRPVQPIRAPQPFETALEIPWNLQLSPSEQAGWAHSTAAVTHNGRTELWHTRLGVRRPDGTVDEDDDANRTLRAIWALDPKFQQHLGAPLPNGSINDDAVPFRMSLTELDRHDVVRLSSDYLIEHYKPSPMHAESLMLSALGAWIDSRGAWDPPTGKISLEEWRQRGTMGRDHFVRIVRRGFLFPFGHKAVLVKITERKIWPTQVNGANRAAYLRQRFFLVVRQERRDYAGAPLGQRYAGRAFPFKNVRITTRVTPNLDAPQSFDPVVGSNTRCFVPNVANAPFLFHMVGEDWANERIELAVPAVFVDETIAYDWTTANPLVAPKMVKLVDTYAYSDPKVRTANLEGQRVSLAESVKKGDTTVQVKTLLFGADNPVPPLVPLGGGNPFIAADQPPFHPTLSRAATRLSAAEQVSGKSVGPSIAYDINFLKHGFPAAGAKAGEVFARIVDPVTGLPANQKLGFGADKSGGAATPNIAIEGLSRRLGPVGDADNIDAGKLVPKSFLDGAKMMGGLDLFKVIVPEIGVVPLPDGSMPPEVMKLLQHSFPDRIETKLHWELDHTKLVKDDAGIFEPHGNAKLTIDAHLIARLDHPEKSTYDIEGKLKHFTLNLLGDGAAQFIILDFHYLKFTSKTGKKPHVDVDIANVDYAGVLKFVKKLADLMNVGDGGSGPAIELTPTGIRAAFDAPIPSLQVGVFSLSNMRFGAAVNIPFSGKPARVRFDFSKKHDPFVIAVSMFGGGGFFSLAVGTDGVELVEAALEFGANISLDIGIASGGIHVMGGVYFKYAHDEEKDCDTVVLTAYIRMGGELNVLGIVSISLELNLSLTYKSVTVNGKEKDKVVGKAELELEVRVLIFHATLHATIKKQFGNAPGDPTFADFMPADLPSALPGESLSSAWNEYCDAFAEEAA
jgi:hypothetical protein